VKQANTYRFSQAGLFSSFDYSPFGVQLDGRTIGNVFYYPESENAHSTSFYN